MIKYIMIYLLVCFLIPEKVVAQSNNAESLYRRARGLENTGLIDEAENIYNQIFIKNPNNEKYYNALKKILIKKNDCLEMMNNVEIFSNARANSKYSKINTLEIEIICNADWENTFNNLVEKNITDLAFLNKVFSKLMNNGQAEYALSSIPKIREISNKESFYANELGYYYMSMKKYDQSVEEFLKHLKQFPNHLEMINQRIATFPELSKFTNEKIINHLISSDTKESKIILADFYFKLKLINESVGLLKKYGLMSELLSLTQNIEKLNQIDLSNELFIYIIENGNQKIAQKAVFEFAKSLENRSFIDESQLPISQFMKKNSFFSSPFVKIKDSDSNLMHRAISLYDSLSTNQLDLNSFYRLGEIQFRALEDLDAAFEIYKEIYGRSYNRDLRLKALKRMIDVSLAKGNLETSKQIINEYINQNIWSEDDRIELRMKQNQILFYESNIDFLYDDLSIILKDFSVDHKDYNEILDVMRVLIIFKNKQNIFEKYTKAQFKIHQNRRNEALLILNDLLIGCEDNLLKSLISYQLASLLIKQNKIDAAIEQLKSFKHEGVYNELSLLMLAEIDDYLLKDYTAAKKQYYDFLVNYPSSIYQEPTRIRLKKITELSIQ